MTIATLLSLSVFAAAFAYAWATRPGRTRRRRSRRLALLRRAYRLICRLRGQSPRPPRRAPSERGDRIPAAVLRYPGSLCELPRVSPPRQALRLAFKS